MSDAEVRKPKRGRSIFQKRLAPALPTSQFSDSIPEAAKEQVRRSQSEHLPWDEKKRALKDDEGDEED